VNIITTAVGKSCAIPAEGPPQFREEGTTFEWGPAGLWLWRRIVSV